MVPNTLAMNYISSAPQRGGLGRELHEAFPVFDAEFDAMVDRLDDTVFTQAGVVRGGSGVVCVVAVVGAAPRFRGGAIRRQIMRPNAVGPGSPSQSLTDRRSRPAGPQPRRMGDQEFAGRLAAQRW